MSGFAGRTQSSWRAGPEPGIGDCVPVAGAQDVLVGNGAPWCRFAEPTDNESLPTAVVGNDNLVRRQPLDARQAGLTEYDHQRMRRTLARIVCWTGCHATGVSSHRGGIGCGATLPAAERPSLRVSSSPARRTAAGRATTPMAANATVPRNR